MNHNNLPFELKLTTKNDFKTKVQTLKRKKKSYLTNKHPNHVLIMSLQKSLHLDSLLHLTKNTYITNNNNNNV